MLELAWRNVWRNRRRTILTIVAIAFATGIVVFSQGLQVSTHETSTLATTRIFQGALQLQRTDYFDNPQIYRSLSDLEELRDQILAVSGVEYVSIRAVGFALVSSEERTYGIQIVGVEPEHEPEVSTIPSLVRHGTYFEAEHGYPAVIGAALARNLRVDIGDEITMLGQGKDGSLAAAILSVSGIYESGSPEVDRALVQIPLKVFQELFYMHDEAHLFVIQIAELSELQAIQPRIQAALDDPTLKVLRWDEITPGLKQAQEFDRITDWIFLFSLIIIVVFGILNSFLMSILERTREFGMLLALGMKPLQITKLILFECVQLVSLGTAAGSLIGAAIIFYFNQYGFVIPGAQEFLSTWNLPEALYPRITFEALVTGPIVVLFSSLLLLLPFSLRPLWLQPVEAMQS